MAKNYRITHALVGPWRKDDVVSEDHIDNLQGNDPRENDTRRGARVDAEIKRLTDLGAIEETSDKVTIDALDGHPGPEHTKGDNVDPGSDDDVHKRAKRREEAVGKGNTGMPGAGGAGATVASADELHDLTVPELKAQADGLGIEGTSGMTKDELVKDIRKAQKKAAK